MREFIDLPIKGINSILRGVHGVEYAEILRPFESVQEVIPMGFRMDFFDDESVYLALITLFGHPDTSFLIIFFFMFRRAVCYFGF
jgi:hypothetical protein